ncbi:MAG: DUF89 family protein [Firmicutes bacterium]|jgi:uncharacterized protein with ATP-grasp and redox domains|nr:DUF89 family protein [Bacillota bacterium]
MKVQLDCVQCSLRQALEAARLVTTDLDIQKTIVLKSLEILSKYDSYKTSPEMGGAVHEVVKEYTGNEDPYEKVKRVAIKMAHDAHPALKRYVETQEDRLLSALEVSAVGNLLDAGVYGDMRTVDMEAVLNRELTKGFTVCDIKALREDLKNAETIVIIGDNAGETVLDRILISEIKNVSGGKVGVFYGVRGVPIINDATAEDAVASGLDHDATIISTGSVVPGLVLDKADPDFLKLYCDADVVISKGQGNYETLSDAAGRALYFLLKAKCEAVARDIAVSVGANVLVRKQLGEEEEFRKS